MNKIYKVLEQCENAKEAESKLAALDSEARDFVLFELANDIESNAGKIIEANKKDIKNSAGRLSGSMLKRLKIDRQKIIEMCQMVRSVAKLEDPVGKLISVTKLDEGLILKKVSVPIGVICCIFESRPEVAVQISALAIKSGNAVLLKGGKEAANTNRVLADIIRKSIADNKGMPADAVQLLETREEVKEILKMDEFIDLIIPRGSNSLVKHIKENTKIPVLGHSEGICNVFVDRDADIKMALRIAIDAKTQYAAVCNAMENLVVHKDISGEFIPKIVSEFIAKGVEVRADSEAIRILKLSKKIPIQKIKKAEESDWDTEYSDMIISIKTVGSLEEAIDFINRHGSGHTDSIVTENKKSADKFITFVDSSSVMWNASTRFSDGFRYGLGAEVGISTNKIHARGPVGLEGLVIYKYILEGKGHIVEDYAKGRKKFVHKRIK